MREVLLEREVLSDEKNNYRVVYYSPEYTRYYRNGKLHRDDGPAWICKKYQGIEIHRYYRNGKLTRTDGPAAYTLDTKENEITSFSYYQNGKMNRLNGPASWSNNGHNAWYYKDQRLGENAQGFWNLWDKLTDEQRNNLDLLMWLPKM